MTPASLHKLTPMPLQFANPVWIDDDHRLGVLRPERDSAAASYAGTTQSMHAHRGSRFPRAPRAEGGCSIQDGRFIWQLVGVLDT